MGNLNFIELTDIDNKNRGVVAKNEPIITCENRCKHCPLFPYDKLSIKDVNETPDRRIFDVNGQQHKLTNHGFRLMCAMTRYSGTVLSREFLSEYVWPESDVVGNNLNVAICDLRMVFRNSLINIENHRKEGYSLIL